MTEQELIYAIRKGEIDCNNYESFFSLLVRGLVNDLNHRLYLRGKNIPHFILHTGDDIMYRELQGYDHSKEPAEVSNENYVYNEIPRCIVTVGSVDMIPDQLTNPYALGNLQFEYEDMLLALTAEVRRMPLRLGIDLKYYADTFTDQLSITQQIISNFAFIKVFSITYLGQRIKCSYKIPDNVSNEHMAELAGNSEENRNESRTISLSLELETNFPIYANATIMSSVGVFAKAVWGNDLTGHKPSNEDIKRATPGIYDGNDEVGRTTYETTVPKTDRFGNIQRDEMGRELTEEKQHTLYPGMRAINPKHGIYRTGSIEHRELPQDDL